jgi:hypothetical protein
MVRLISLSRLLFLKKFHSLSISCYSCFGAKISLLCWLHFQRFSGLRAVRNGVMFCQLVCCRNDIWLIA